MSDGSTMPALVAAMGRAWNSDPGGVAFGSERTGIGAALWTHGKRGILEVAAAPTPDVHIVCLQMTPLEADFFIDGRLRYAGHYVAGDVSFIEPGGTPRAVMRGRYSCLHIYVPSALVDGVVLTDMGQRPSEPLNFTDSTGSSSPAMLRVGREILAEMSSGGLLSRSRADALGLDVAVQMLRHHSRLTASVNRLEHRGGLAPWQIRRVREMIAAEPEADQSLAMLSSEVGLSTYHFSRAFKKSMGMPPHAYQMSVRIERAKLLLTTTSQNVTEIAHSIGYESSQALARAFARQCGCTPSAFRRRYT